MKVTPKEIAGLEKIQKARKEEKNAASFQEVLKNTLEKSGGASNADALSSITPLSQTSPIQISPVALVAGNPVVKEIESLVELLEEYQEKMENPSFTLKDIHPLILRMEGETERLQPVLNSMPEGSAAKDILNRALVASAVEVIKFNRGDYN